MRRGHLGCACKSDVFKLDLLPCADENGSIEESAIPAGQVTGNEPNNSASQRGKACLQRYRRASAEVFAIFKRMFPKSVLEKASIDEAYFGEFLTMQLNPCSSDIGYFCLETRTSSQEFQHAPGCHRTSALPAVYTGICMPSQGRQSTQLHPVTCDVMLSLLLWRFLTAQVRRYHRCRRSNDWSQQPRGVPCMGT